MLRSGCRSLLLVPSGNQPRVLQLSTVSSPEWNRKNKLTKVLPKINKPKDYALGIYTTLKGHYDEMTGMPRIEAAQQSVVEIERSLTEVQNKKRPIKLELQRLREHIHDLNHSLQMCKRHDPQYLNLMQQLVDLNQKEASEQENYDMVEEETRDLFEQYKSAVMKSYAVERTQTTHFKYFSFIFSSVCGGMTFLALLLKYITQSAEFKEMQQIMERNEELRQQDESKAQLELEGMQVLLQKQTIILDKLLQQTRPRKEVKASSGSSLYDWVAWACRPLKFW